MKNRIVVLLFCTFIFGFGIANILVKNEEISITERRKLAKLPDLNFENIVNGEVFDKFETYALDHFVLRDDFRTIKAFVELNVFRKKDYNNLYTHDGYIFKKLDNLDINNTELFSKKINTLYNTYLKDMNVYYSLIPNKSYYLDSGHLDINYDDAITKIQNEINNKLTFIDIKDVLTLDSYYYTDIHWKQEKLGAVVDKLSSYMNFNLIDNYVKKEYEPFYGSYYGSLSIGAYEDKLYYLSNEFIDNAIVKDQGSDLEKVYELDALGSVDSYDVFLGGPTPFIEIENTMADNEKELIIFRDSFGSSLAPLLILGYKKITLVDLRYMDARLLNNYITFDNQDVLILYNMEIVLNSNMLKI